MNSLRRLVAACVLLSLLLCGCGLILGSLGEKEKATRELAPKEADGEVGTLPVEGPRTTKKAATTTTVPPSATVLGPTTPDGSTVPGSTPQPGDPVRPGDRVPKGADGSPPPTMIILDPVKGPVVVYAPTTVSPTTTAPPVLIESKLCTAYDRFGQLGRLAALNVPTASDAEVLQWLSTLLGAMSDVAAQLDAARAAPLQAVLAEVGAQGLPDLGVAGSLSAFVANYTVRVSPIVDQLERECYTRGGTAQPASSLPEINQIPAYLRGR